MRSFCSGPGCSKLTTSLLNVSLNFQILISRICQYFLLKKCEKLWQCKASLIFSTKNISVFSHEVVEYLTSWPLNELVNLRVLWTTGPWRRRFPILSCVFYGSNPRPPGEDPFWTLAPLTEQTRLRFIGLCSIPNFKQLSLAFLKKNILSIFYSQTQDPLW